MSRPIMPSTIAPPAAEYAHAVLTTRPERWLHTSGVVPVDRTGAVPVDLADQARVVWANLGEILSDADMGPADVVSVTTYVVVDHDLGPVMAARDSFLGGHRAASTLVVVPRLAQPQWLMEIAIVAAT